MLTGANGYAMDEANTKFDAMVIEGDTILAIGSKADLRLQFGTKVTKTVDVNGATVIPGLVDNHLHLSGVGEQLMRLDLTGTKSKAELLLRIRAWAANLPEGAWIQGVGWDENQFHDQQIPSIEELDAASLGHPLLLMRVCRHVLLANHQAFHLAGLGEQPSDPEGGAYGRDVHGKLNGLVYEERAFRPLLSVIPTWTSSDWQKALKMAINHSLSFGLTAVHTDDTRYMGGFISTWNLYQQLLNEGNMRLRVHELVGEAFVKEYISFHKEMPPEDDWFSVGAVKLFADGSFGGRTAWLSEPYADLPGVSGLPIDAPDVLRDKVYRLHEAGLPVAIHAIGDAALEAALSAIEGAPEVKRRDRIVHAELIRPDLVNRMAMLGDRLAIDIQPRFAVSDFPWLINRIGRERSAYACAWNTMKQAGLHVGGGSDAPIEPVNPLLGIHAAVTRNKPDQAGKGYLMEQAMSPYAAVKLFTHDGSFAIGAEEKKGCLLPGWQADVTVLDRDIVASQSTDDIRDAKVLSTIVGGQVAYSR